MFIRATTLKKWCKRSYKGQGITIENTGDAYALAGDIFQLEVNCDYLNKKAMAAIVEIVGALPEKGQCITYQCGRDPQFCTQGAAYRQIDDWEMSGQQFEYTRIVVKAGEDERLLQRTGTCPIFVREEFIEALDDRELEETEFMPRNPTLYRDMIVWNNDAMQLAVPVRIVRYKKEAEILSLMTGKDMYWELIASEEIGA